MRTCRGKGGDPVFNVSEIKNRIDHVKQDPYCIVENTKIIFRK